AHHTGGVEREHVAGGNELGEIGESAMTDLAALATDDHEPTLVATRGRNLRDSLWRENEIVIGRAVAVHDEKAIVARLVSVGQHEIRRTESKSRVEITHSLQARLKETWLT